MESSNTMGPPMLPLPPPCVEDVATLVKGLEEPEPSHCKAANKDVSVAGGFLDIAFELRKPLKESGNIITLAESNSVSVLE